MKITAYMSMTGLDRLYVQFLQRFLVDNHCRRFRLVSVPHHFGVIL